LIAKSSKISKNSLNESCFTKLNSIRNNLRLNEIKNGKNPLSSFDFMNYPDLLARAFLEIKTIVKDTIIPNRLDKDQYAFLNDNSEINFIAYHITAQNLTLNNVFEADPNIHSMDFLLHETIAQQLDSLLSIQRNVNNLNQSLAFTSDTLIDIQNPINSSDSIPQNSSNSGIFNNHNNNHNQVKAQDPYENLQQIIDEYGEKFRIAIMAKDVDPLQKAHDMNNAMKELRVRYSEVKGKSLANASRVTTDILCLLNQEGLFSSYWLMKEYLPIDLRNSAIPWFNDIEILMKKALNKGAYQIFSPTIPTISVIIDFASIDKTPFYVSLFGALMELEPSESPNNTNLANDVLQIIEKFNRNNNNNNKPSYINYFLKLNENSTIKIRIYPSVSETIEIPNPCYTVMFKNQSNDKQLSEINLNRRRKYNYLVSWNGNQQWKIMEPFESGNLNIVEIFRKIALNEINN